MPASTSSSELSSTGNSAKLEVGGVRQHHQQRRGAAGRMQAAQLEHERRSPAPPPRAPASAGSGISQRAGRCRPAPTPCCRRAPPRAAPAGWPAPRTPAPRWRPSGATSQGETAPAPRREQRLTTPANRMPSAAPGNGAQPLAAVDRHRRRATGAASQVRHGAARQVGISAGAARRGLEFCAGIVPDCTTKVRRQRAGYTWNRRQK